MKEQNKLKSKEVIFMRPLMKFRKPDYFMSNIQDELNRIIEETFGELQLPEMLINREEKTWIPAVELSENDGNYMLKAELPGVKKENIDVEIGEKSITIKAETNHKMVEEKENLYRSEFRYGKYLRTISFPTDVNTQDAKAEYKDGILMISVPKTEEESKKLKKLEIIDKNE